VGSHNNSVEGGIWLWNLCSTNNLHLIADFKNQPVSRPNYKLVETLRLGWCQFHMGHYIKFNKDPAVQLRLKTNLSDYLKNSAGYEPLDLTRRISMYHSQSFFSVLVV